MGAMFQQTPRPCLSALVIIVFSIVSILDRQANFCRAQQQIGGRSSIGATTLVVRDNSNGALSVVDGQQQQQQQQQQLEVNTNEQEQLAGDQEQQVVAGLLEWLKKKKREKEEKKNKEKQPIILPVPVPQPQPVQPQRHERKEIHIHINNHIKKGHYKQQQHQPHKKKHHHGGYEDYHAGDYGHDYHDKHYMGKFYAPLLSHHFSFDHFDHGGYHHDDHHGGDYHAGYESRPEPQAVAAKPVSETKPTTRRTTSEKADDN